MDLRTIQEKLNEEFRSSERKLVFWYDDNAEFAEEIDSLQLDNAKLHKLTGDNAPLYKVLFGVRGSGKQLSHICSFSKAGR
jgi:hypothetical protein